jgi:hypothetical protein
MEFKRYFFPYSSSQNNQMKMDTDRCVHTIRVPCMYPVLVRTFYWYFSILRVWIFMHLNLLLFLLYTEQNQGNYYSVLPTLQLGGKTWLECAKELKLGFKSIFINHRSTCYMYENEEFLLSIEIQFDTNYLFYNTYTPNVPITCARLRWYMKMEMIWFPLSFWFSTEKWSTLWTITVCAFWITPN